MTTLQLLLAIGVGGLTALGLFALAMRRVVIEALTDTVAEILFHVITLGFFADEKK